MVSSALLSPSAHCTASSTSLASRGLSRSVIAMRSKPRNIRERHLSAAHMHAAELGAAMQRRKHLAGIEQALGVERAFEALLRLEVDLREHGRHEIALLHPDAVLAGEHAAHLDAQLEDLGAECFGALQLARLVGVVEDERMQVAVASVKHVSDAQA